MILPADIHTHNPDPTRDALIHLEAMPGLIVPDLGLYSVGIHPWEAGAKDIDERLQVIARLINHPRVLAIGEAGLDRRHDPDLGIQQQVFEAQASLARDNDMPMIIHCVRAWDTLLAMHKRFNPKPSSPWIIHGFRGKPALADQLLNAGMLLSYGSRYNPDSLAITPHPLHETD